jgi:hypothetical protein
MPGRPAERRTGSGTGCPWPPHRCSGLPTESQDAAPRCQALEFHLTLLNDGRARRLEQSPRCCRGLPPGRSGPTARALGRESCGGSHRWCPRREFGPAHAVPLSPASPAAFRSKARSAENERASGPRAPGRACPETDRHVQGEATPAVVGAPTASSGPTLVGAETAGTWTGSRPGSPRRWSTAVFHRRPSVPLGSGSPRTWVGRAVCQARLGAWTAPTLNPAI